MVKDDNASIRLVRGTEVGARIDGFSWGVAVPLRRHAIEMRNMYANAIAKAVSEGKAPSKEQVASWAKYDAAAHGADPAAAFAPPKGIPEQ